ncbi:MAG: PEP-CTERM sorting domain-containing protein [Verrucomicrobiota bacterium]|nr:PEP-CTERM sorting domain-containing protein [Verrucomicrobiota bacterium]
MKKFLAPLLVLLGSATTYATFSVALDAGQLRSNSTTGLPVGSVLILIAAGADGIFQTPTQLTAGRYVAGDDVLLSVMTDPNSAGTFNTAGGTNETNSPFSVVQMAPATPGAVPSGQLIGLMWLPGITYAQWLAGTTPSAGQTFGFYNPLFWGNATNNPDGGNAWAVPDTGVLNLNFFTTDSDFGGTQAPSRGFGNNFVVLIPEPSTYALLLAGIAGLFVWRRRVKVA